MSQTRKVSVRNGKGCDDQAIRHPWPMQSLCLVRCCVLENQRVKCLNADTGSPQAAVALLSHNDVNISLRTACCCCTPLCQTSEAPIRPPPPFCKGKYDVLGCPRRAARGARRARSCGGGSSSYGEASACSSNTTVHGGARKAHRVAGRARANPRWRTPQEAWDGVPDDDVFVDDVPGEERRPCSSGKLGGVGRRALVWLCKSSCIW